MSDPFAITARTKTLKLDDKGHAQAAFDVKNVSGSLITHGRVRVVPEDPAITTWLTLDGEPERRYAIDEVQSFTVQVQAPPPPPPLQPGLYNFRLDAFDMAAPDSTLSTGARVTVTIPAPDVKKPLPWLWIAGGAAALLVVIGIIVFLLWPKSSKFSGDWVLNFGTMHLNQNGNTVTGTFVDQVDNSSGTVEGTVADNTLTGGWRGNGSGALVLTVDANNETVDGTRNGRDSWCGAKPGRVFPPGCSFSGSWRTSIDGAQFDMNLNRTDSTVVGSYTFTSTSNLAGQVTGTLGYNGVTTVLTGTYQIVPVNTPTRPLTGTLQFFINGPNAVQFSGSWRESATRGGAWCGWRTGSGVGTPVPSPVPCRRP
jgi:hypothetical protein